MRGRFGRLPWLVLAMVPASAGCIVPSYQLPAGFSSSYERQIYGLDPAPPPVTLGVAAMTTNAGIFYPMTAFRDQPNTCGNANGNRPPGPMVLGLDPLSPPPKVAERPPLDISVN